MKLESNRTKSPHTVNGATANDSKKERKHSHIIYYNKRRNYFFFGAAANLAPKDLATDVLPFGDSLAGCSLGTD